jgi:hypothetical protein
MVVVAVYNCLVTSCYLVLQKCITLGSEFDPVLQLQHIIVTFYVILNNINKFLTVMCTFFMHKCCKTTLVLLVLVILSQLPDDGS